MFILMVFVSGVILTFLSINNITNLRILTEKKIQETQLEIAGQISNHFNQIVQKATEDFSREWSGKNARLPADSMFFTLQQIPVLPFLLNSENNFISPNFPETGLNTGIKQSGSINPDFTSGEADEFQNENYPKAVSEYLSALSRSRTPGDSAKVLNALGRVSVKLKQFDKAYFYYSALFSGLSKELNTTGIPFSYFAVSQLIKLPLPEKQQETVRLTGLFLKQLNQDKIPLNPGTKTILEEVSGWLSAVQVPEEQKKSIRLMLESINSKLDFITNYGSKIREVIAFASPSEFPEISGKYSAFAINRGENPELIIIDRESEIRAGFVISLKSIWQSVTSHLPEEKESEYIIELVQGSSLSINQDVLSIRAELSPFFPMHRIVIKPANENVVEKFVRSRSWTYGIALVLLLGGMSLGIVLILRDISREKKMADMQSEFVSHVTHELKTPLTSINMFAETIFFDRAKTPELRKKYSNIIMKESEVLKRKIDNILEYSARKSEKSKYRIRETNLTELVDEVMEEMKYWLDINNFEVTRETEPEVIANVDAEALKQALSNLVGNAIKYSSDRKHLFVRLYRKDGKIMVEVEDTGIGIPKDQTDLIFEKFYRVKSRENESATGTGLGLSVTRDIVNAHGGKIFVESEINKGSKFTIQLNVT